MLLTNTVVNRTNVVNVYNNRNLAAITYMNRAVPNGVTVVAHDTFVNARPVARDVMNVPERELASAPVNRGNQIAPERTSVYGAGNRNAPGPQERAMNRPVVMNKTPPPAPNHFEPPQITRMDRAYKSNDAPAETASTGAASAGSEKGASASADAK